MTTWTQAGPDLPVTRSSRIISRPEARIPSSSRWNASASSGGKMSWSVRPRMSSRERPRKSQKAWLTRRKTPFASLKPIQSGVASTTAWRRSGEWRPSSPWDGSGPPESAGEPGGGEVMGHLRKRAEKTVHPSCSSRVFRGFCQKDSGKGGLSGTMFTDKETLRVFRVGRLHWRKE